MSQIHVACIALSAGLLVGVPAGGTFAAEEQAKPPSAAERLQPATAGTIFGFLHLEVVESDLSLTATQCVALNKPEEGYDAQVGQLPATQPVKNGVDEYANKLSAIDNLFAPKLIAQLDEKQIARIREIE
jgi:hypothetical protein